MTWSIYKYELNYWLKRPSTYLYCFIFFGFALLLVLGTGGYFDGVSASDSKVKVINSHHELNEIFQYFIKFFMFLIPAIIGATIYKDFDNRAHHIIYSYPIKKHSYLIGKFLSGLSILIFISLFAGFAMILGELILGEANPKINPFDLSAYLHAFVFVVWSNMLIFGVLVFVIVTISRNIYAGFLTVLIIFLLQIIVENAFTNQAYLMALLDPFGQNSARMATRFWTLDEQNTLPLPIGGILFHNRLFWLLIIGLVLPVFYRYFEFSQDSSFLKFVSSLKRRNIENTLRIKRPNTSRLTSVSTSTSVKQQIKALFELSVFELKFILKNPMFLVLLVFAIVAILFTLLKIIKTDDLTLLPLTRIMLNAPLFFYLIIVTLATFIFTGMSVHRSRVNRINQLVDVTSISNASLLGSKFLAIAYMQIIFLFLMLFCGVAIQVYSSFYEFELGLYLYQLFILSLPILLIWAMVSFFIHSIFRNLYIGLFILVLAWIGKDEVSRIGLDTYLAKFNSRPELLYSDICGFNEQLQSYHLVGFYWLFFGLAILVLSYLFSTRGFLFSLREKFEIAFSRIGKYSMSLLGILLIVFFSMGFKIHKHEGETYSAKQKFSNTELLKRFRKNFSQYEYLAMPKIVSVDLNLDVFPKKKSFSAKGEYVLVNKSSTNIDSLLVKTSFDEQSSFNFDVPFELLKTDTFMHYSLVQLDKSLKPGDSLQMTFDINSISNTVFERNSNVIENSTFIKQDVFPRLGYFYSKEELEPSDSRASEINFYAFDSDVLSLKTTFSTDENQLGIAPGVLISKTNKNGRNTFVYKTDNLIKFLFAFHSVDLDILEDTYEEVVLKIYHLKKHKYNAQNMVDGLKAALKYNTTYFSEFPFKELSVVEFPYTEESFSATVVANVIPTSETQFILNNRSADNIIQLPFYVQAHELTHQWFGNQLVPARALGAKLLTEGLTEYVSLKIYEKTFGKEKALDFLKIQRRRYLRGRTKETKKENPLYRVRSDQEYIAYGKGAMALNSLSHHLGESAFNRILKDFLHKYSGNYDVYPTSIDFVSHLRASLPADLHYILEDMFENISFYENKINSSICTSSKSNDYLVEVDLEIRKYILREQKEYVEINDIIELGLYNENGSLIEVKSFRISEESNKLAFRVKEKVYSIMLDPNFLLIDKNIENNRIGL